MTPQTTHEVQQTADAVVIGGGLAGLAAALLLARQGLKPYVLEKAQHPGGRAITRQQDGFHFNLGPHALYLGGAGHSVLRELDIQLAGNKVDTNNVHALYGDQISDLPTGLGTILSTRLLSFTEKLSLGRLVANMVRATPTDYTHLTIGDWLAERVEQPILHELGLALLRLITYTNAPDMLSAEVALAQFQTSLAGVRYLDDGWQVLVDQLRNQLEAEGGQVLTSIRVEEVLVENDQVVGVEYDGGQKLHAPAVIVATSPHQALSIIPETVGTGWRAFAETAVPVRAACLNLGLTQIPVPERRVVLGIDRPYYFSTHSRWAKLAPDGQHLIHVAKYLPPGEVDPAAARAELEVFLDTIQPGWRTVTLTEQFLPNLTVINAIPSAEQGGFAARPAPVVDGVRGLYLAGDWVGSSSWLADASLASAQTAAQHAARLAQATMAPVMG